MASSKHEGRLTAPPYKDVNKHSTAKDSMPLLPPLYCVAHSDLRV